MPESPSACMAPRGNVQGDFPWQRATMGPLRIERCEGQGLLLRSPLPTGDIPPGGHWCQGVARTQGKVSALVATKGNQGGMFPLMWATVGPLRIEQCEGQGLHLRSPLPTQAISPDCHWCSLIVWAQGEVSAPVATRGNQGGMLPQQKGPPAYWPVSFSRQKHLCSLCWPPLRLPLTGTGAE